MNVDKPEAALVFFLLAKLRVIELNFHREGTTVWVLPTERVVPGASGSFGNFCYTWKPL